MTPRQNRFIHEYLKDLNGTQAAIRAGYSKRSARQEADRLMSDDDIKTLIDAAIARREQRCEVKQDDVLRELLRLATTDVGQAFDEMGALLPLHEMNEDVRRSIVSVEVDEQTDDEGKVVGYTRKVKFSDKKGPLELLGKHLNMFAEKHEFEAGEKLMQLLGATTKPEELAREMSKLSPEQQLEVARGK